MPAPDLVELRFDCDGSDGHPSMEWTGAQTCRGAHDVHSYILPNALNASRLEFTASFEYVVEGVFGPAVRVQGSHDGINWLDIVWWTGADANALSIEGDAPVPAPFPPLRLVRIEFSEEFNEMILTDSTLRLWGTPAAAPQIVDFSGDCRTGYVQARVDGACRLGPVHGHYISTGLNESRIGVTAGYESANEQTLICNGNSIVPPTVFTTARGWTSIDGVEWTPFEFTSSGIGAQYKSANAVFDAPAPAFWLIVAALPPLLGDVCEGLEHGLGWSSWSALID